MGRPKKNRSASKTKPAAAPVDSIKHKSDSRPNIPTRELAGFAAADEQTPKTVLYPRDPSLDPQLVWRGKDEQDAHPLEVPAVPVYIQEKIHPQAIIEDIRERAAAAKPPPADLFADFNGLEDDFAQKVDFYRHDQHWTNRLILGDSLLVMTSLAEKERHKGRVQMIYCDPPYGIKFPSNWQVSTRKRDVKDAKAEDVTRQPEQIKAFRDTWELGIHSYLTYFRDRLTVARDLLTESGSVFVQIGDENVHLVRSLMDEVFGSENFVSLITVKKTTGAGSFAGGTTLLANVSDYVLWYAYDATKCKFRQLYGMKSRGDRGATDYQYVEDGAGNRRRLTSAELESGVATGRVFTLSPMTSQTTRVGQTTIFPVEIGGRTISPTTGGWKTNREGMKRLLAANRIHAREGSLRYVRYMDDFPAFPISNSWEDTIQLHFLGKRSHEGGLTDGG
jgi:adenine-specific DNA-methyltransferase